MSLEEIKHALLELKSVGVTKVVFRRRTVSQKDISDMVIMQKGFKYTIDWYYNKWNSFGLWCAGENCKSCRLIAVSIDGYSKEHPTFIRDEGIFETVIKGWDNKDIGIKVSILQHYMKKMFTIWLTMLILQKN